MPEHRNEDAAGATATQTAPPKLDRLPPYRVMLHNDDVNEMLDVVSAILELTRLNRTRAFEIMLTAQEHGCCLVLITHRERAELYQDQFRSKGLTVTIEPNV